LGALGSLGALTGCGDSSDSSSSQGSGAEQGGGAAANGTGASVSGSDKETIIALDSGNEPAAGFDPLHNWGCAEHMHEPLIQSTLVNTTADMGFVNDLATGYETSADGLTWTFTLRSDVKFSDGQPLTATDVAFTLNGIKAAEGSETDLSMLDAATATDDVTVQIKLTRPYNALLYTLAVIGIVPEHAYGPDYGENPIGSGRYILTQWDKGQQVILEANPGYYGAKPQIERVVIVFMSEDASLAAVRSGQVDVAQTSQVFSDQTLTGYSLFAAKTVDSRGISLPTLPPGDKRIADGQAYPAGNAVTSDIAIRRALNYATDRQLAASNALNGYATAAYSVCGGMPWANAELDFETDVEKARQLLDEAGWLPGADGVRSKDGQRAELTLYYNAADSARQALANEFANQVFAAGIEVNVKGESWDVIYGHMYTDPIVWGWGSNSPAELYNLYHSGGSSNFPCYDNPIIDGYLEAALATSELEDSYPLWQQAQWDGTVGEGVQGAATWVWLVNIDHLYFVRAGLAIAEQKLHPHGHGWALLNNVDQWHW
jgi:peptide/nickel transport system substrate-binding protein